MNIPTSPLKPPLPPPPPEAAAHHSGLSDSSPLLPIITILAFVIVVVLIYAFFFAVRCRTTISNRLRRSSGGPAGNATSTHLGTNTDALDQLVSSVAYKEATDAGKDCGGGGECPVCLTAFVDGEVIREVKVCKHLFHDSCIEVWLRAHSNCPVCRVFVGTKWSKRPAVGGGGDEDFRQALTPSLGSHLRPQLPPKILLPTSTKSSPLRSSARLVLWLSSVESFLRSIGKVWS